MASSSGDATWTNNFVDNMFKKAGLVRSAFHEISKDQLDAGIEGIVRPLRMHPAVCEAAVKTDMYRVGTSSAAAEEVSIVPFSSERMLSVLDMDNSGSGPGTKIRIPGMGGRGRGRGRGRGAADNSTGGMRRVHSTAFDDVTGAVGDEVENELKRRRVEAAAAAAQQLEDEKEQFGTGAASSSSAAVTTTIVADIYPSLWELFDRYWSLKLEHSTGVAAAFFARITQDNCHDYGLASFAPVSSSLPVIKDRLEKRKYVKAEDFRLDFKRMFKNVSTHYPNDHPAVAKAIELDELFDKLWRAVRLKLYGVP